MKASLPSIRGELLKAAEVAEMLKVSPKLVYNMATANEIPAHMVRGAKRFDSADINDYLFLSKFAAGGVRLKPADAEELLRRLDERHASDRAYIKAFIEKEVSDAITTFVKPFHKADGFGATRLALRKLRGCLVAAGLERFACPGFDSPALPKGRMLFRRTARSMEDARVSSPPFPALP